MAIKGPSIKSDLLLDISQFIKASNLASRQLKKSLGGMDKQVGGFAESMDKHGRKISGSWWKRYGAVALGFTIAYRAMNLFENGLMKLGGTFKEAILQSGQLAEQQAKNAFWMTVFADKSITFADAFRQASGAINALRVESVRSISSIDELTTGIDELAQAGLPITEKLMPQMVSLVDFTGMVAQTVGSTTRQIRQEMQALMDGTTRVTNQLVRVLTNMGVLTRENLSDLKKMINRAEIFEKVVGAIHERWLAMVETLIRSSPERAFAYWEKSIQKVLVQAVLLASQMKGVENLFGETLFQAANRFRDGIKKADLNRLVYLIGLLNDGLVFLVELFNKSVTGVATLATVAGNLARELSHVWSFLGNVAAITLTIKAIQLLGKTMLWLIVGPAKVLAKTVLIAFSPLLIAAAAAGAAIVLVIGQISIHAEELKAAWDDVKDSFNLMKDSILGGLSEIKKDLVSLIDKLNVVKNWDKEFLAIPEWMRKQSEWSKQMKPWGKEPERPENLPEDFLDFTSISKVKDFIIKEAKAQANAFKTGLDVVRKAVEPYINYLTERFDKLFDAPPVPDFADAGKAIDVLFSQSIPPLVLADLKKLEREMDNFSDKTPAFVKTLGDLKKGLLMPEDVAGVTKLNEITAAYTRMAEALKAQVVPEKMTGDQWLEYFDFKMLLYNWEEAAKAHNKAKFELKRYLEQVKILEDVQEDYYSLVKTGSEYQLWALDEELKKLKVLAIGNEELLAMLEKYSAARVLSIENEFNGLAKLAEDIAQSMENSFSDLFFDVMTASWDDLGDLATNTLRGMQRALADFLAQAAAQAAFGEQTGGGGWAGGFLSNFFSQWLSGGGSGGGIESGGFDPGGYYGEYHKGGIVGSGQAPSKLMPLSLLENAVRLHNGLRSDEYPAILERGEKVYPKGESPIEGVTIINNTGITPEVSETRKSSGGKDISIIIGEMAAKDVYRGGPLGQALKSAYNLQPQTVRR